MLLKKKASPNKKDWFSWLLFRIEAKTERIDHFIPGKSKRTVGDAERKLTFEDIFDRIMGFLALSDISLFGATNMSINRRCKQAKYYKVLDFGSIPAVLSQSSIITKLAYASDQLARLVLPHYLKHSDYKK